MIVLVGRQGEQRIGACLGAADASAQLIELGEAEHVGPPDDQCVRGRDVEAGFDDRRRQQHVVLSLVEGGHDVFELAAAIWPWPTATFASGTYSLEERLRLGDILDARADIRSSARRDSARAAAPRA